MQNKEVNNIMYMDSEQMADFLLHLSYSNEDELSETRSERFFFLNLLLESAKEHKSAATLLAEIVEKSIPDGCEEGVHNKENIMSNFWYMVVNSECQACLGS